MVRKAKHCETGTRFRKIAPFAIPVTIASLKFAVYLLPTDIHLLIIVLSHSDRMSARNHVSKMVTSPYLLSGALRLFRLDSRQRRRALELVLAKWKVSGARRPHGSSHAAIQPFHQLWPHHSQGRHDSLFEKHAQAFWRRIRLHSSELDHQQGEPRGDLFATQGDNDKASTCPFLHLNMLEFSISDTFCFGRCGL